MMPRDATGATVRRKTNNIASHQSQVSQISKSAGNSIIYAEANCDMQNQRNVTTPKSTTKQWVASAEIVTAVTTRRNPIHTPTMVIVELGLRPDRIDVADRPVLVSRA
jgi:hypothetical protein